MARWSTACLDWEQRIVERRSLVPFDPLFPDEAEAAVAVFKSLRIVDAPGSPTFGEACDEFVFDFVRAIFGAYDPVRAERMVKEFFLLISKKNSKSTIAAGIMVTALVRNWRLSALLQVLAPTLLIANNVFEPAMDMVRADEELSALLKIEAHKRIIRHLTTNAVLQVVAADSESAGGTKAAFVLVEELWLFGKRPSANAMLREATGGLVSRPEGFVIYLSTHSDEAPAGVFKEKLEYFRDVRDGKIHDPTSLGLLYEWPAAMLESEAYLEPRNFYVTNPNLGRSVDAEWLERELNKALTGEGESKQLVLAKHLNVEIGLKTRRDRWRGADFWEDAVDPELVDLAALLARCEVAVIGIDGGGFDDMFGLAVIGRERVTKRWLVWAHAWLMREVLDLRKDIAPRLLDFAKAGELTLCDDVRQLEWEPVAIAEQVREAGLLPERSGIGMDPQLVDALLDAFEDADFTLNKKGEDGSTVDGVIVPVAQGWKLSGAVWSCEFKTKSKQMLHGGGQLLTWCVGNAKAVLKGKSTLIEKSEVGRAKIDPLVAVFCAARLMGESPEAVKQSPYRERGLLVI